VIASTKLTLAQRGVQQNRANNPKPSPMTHSQAVTISVDDTQRVSGLLLVPREADACYVLAHGAGAGMAHSFMAKVANGLGERRIATLRYQFPYMEQGSKRPNAPKLAQATVRAAVVEAFRLLPGLALVAGGKSFGGRMTSQAQAETPLPGVRGLVFLGFPLHPPGPTVRRTCTASVRGEDPDAVLARHPRCTRGHPSYAATCRTAWSARNIEAVCGCRPFLSCVGAHRAEGYGHEIRNVGCTGRLGRDGGVANTRCSVKESPCVSLFIVSVKVGRWAGAKHSGPYMTMRGRAH
jgi:hypothetical protein